MHSPPYESKETVSRVHATQVYNKAVNYLFSKKFHMNFKYKPLAIEIIEKFSEKSFLKINLYF